MMLQGLKEELNRIQPIAHFGFVKTIIGSLIHVTGLNTLVSVGSVCEIQNRQGKTFAAEVVGFHDQITLIMSYAAIEGLGPGCQVTYRGKDNVIYPHESWLGRTLNGFAESMDTTTLVPMGPRAYSINAAPPAAHSRRLVEKRIDLGVRALNTFTTCCAGQRMGIFAGSGVGKSVLLSMLSKFSKAEIIVIGLIGERGREVKEFLDKHMGPEGMKRCVVVVATSDEPALMRRRAAYTTLAIAEYFRDQGKEVLCLIDSVTRFAMALREIGLAVGEPPTTKGYTPNVFVELPRLLERAGPGQEHPLTSGQLQGNITGLFTVLVEGDDHNEPISDTVRGILDGHIILERKIAERGRFPAINILRSISRTMPDCNILEETKLIAQARQYLSTYEDMEELIRLGAYRKGSNPAVDAAMVYYDALDGFIAQNKDEPVTFEEGFDQLEMILASPTEGGMI
jgi:flagellar protein export ATPase FliI